MVSGGAGAGAKLLLRARVLAWCTTSIDLDCNSAGSSYQSSASENSQLICLQPLVLYATPSTWTAAVLAAQAALQLEPLPTLP